MKKKVKVEQLKPGMFVNDINCSWMHHSFVGGSVNVKDDKILAKILATGVREVYIDTDKGLDVSDAPTENEVKQKIQTEMNKVVEPKISPKNTTTIQKELAKAKEIKKEAKKTVQSLMDEIRLGKQPELEKADHVVETMVDSIFRNNDALTSLGRIKKVDEYTYYHSVSVSVLMISFGKHLGFDTQLIRKIGVGGLLHDVGKMKIPIEILNKPGKLNDDEFKKIKEHAEHSRVMLDQSPGIDEISVQVAAQHHERYDGSGYSMGLKGEEISKFGQMAAIVDVYDAITSDRCYHRGMEPSEALKKLFEWSDFHFNKDLVQQFIRCMGIYPVGTLVSLESGFLGIILKPGEKSLLHPTVRVVYDTKTKKHITPYDIDLSQPLNTGRKDKVRKNEPSQQWNIMPEKYL
jgi:putative nucleotidyltransferase with HDIG domain